MCIKLHGAMNELSSDNDLFIYVKSYTIATNFNNIFDIAICYSRYCMLQANLLPMVVRQPENEDISGNSLTYVRESNIVMKRVFRHTFRY